MEKSEKAQDEHEKKIEKRLSRLLIGALVFVAVSWIAIFISNIWLLYDNQDFNGGTLGDSFGVVNGLFSGLAFAFLIYTAYMQKEELKLQRKEFKDNRAELARSADAHRELVNLTIAQNKLMVDQNKMMLNFNLDKIHPELEVRGIDLSVEKITRVTLIIKNRELKITDILDEGLYSVRDDGAEIMVPYEYEADFLNPSDRIVIEFLVSLGGIIIEYESSIGIAYHQKIVLGDGGWQALTPTPV